MPFSDTRLLNVLSHTFWFLPNVASCYAMYNLLQQKQNSFTTITASMSAPGPRRALAWMRWSRCRNPWVIR